MAEISGSNDFMQDLKDPGYEIFIILISILSVVNLVILWIPGIDPDSIRVLIIINFFLTAIFLADFLFRLFSSGSKSYYFFRDWGWADLLASVPSLRILRLFRIFKAYRLLRRYGAGNVMKQILKHRAESMLYIVVFCVILVIEAGSFFVLNAERGAADANILTASDALWWACVTITTVGYGDRYPVTTAGRLVGIFIMAMGVGLIGTLAGFISNKLLSPESSDNPQKSADLAQEKKSLQEIRDTLGEQARQNTDLVARLDRIERQLKRE